MYFRFRFILIAIYVVLKGNLIHALTVNKLSGSSRFKSFADFCLTSQQDIIRQLEEEEGGGRFFQQDPWEKANTGHGITAVIQRGELLEKGAISTTLTRGTLSMERASAISSRQNLNPASLVGSTYHAAALSLVLHSKSPMVPTFRADVRYFELENGDGWYGGGADLTPYYLFDEDARSFHGMYKEQCDRYSPQLYPQLKDWCDRYFYLPVRQEHRGIGGIFFDDLSKIENGGIDAAEAFTRDVCGTFMPSYLPIARERRLLPYSEEQRHWQLLRRGRYIEFNMLYDRGVKFGLVPGGRVEAVMVSCPPLVAWDYNFTPPAGSEEERLSKILKQPIDWL